MFQTFQSLSGPEHVAERVKALRALMAKAKLDAVLVPRADKHQGEYVPASAERLQWLTGFSGSAGIAVVAKKSAVLFTDGRYTVQADAETDKSVFEISLLPRLKLAEWLSTALAKGQTVGFDPWLHTAGEIARLKALLALKGIKLKALAKNPIDTLWGKARPKPPSGPVIAQPLALAGKSAAEKIAHVQALLKKDGQHAVILTLPDSICWLLNIRGSDVAHNPVVLAFAIVPATGKAELFVDPARLDAEARAHLAPVAKLLRPGALADRLSALKKQGKRVRLRPLTRPPTGSKPSSEPAQSPADRIRAFCLKRSRPAPKLAAHGPLTFATAEPSSGFLLGSTHSASDGTLDEITAVRKLEEFRRDTNMLRDISFATISGSGPNGAIVHYRVTEATNRRMKPGELFLIDSGAQYQDGTTDITRTVAIGEPSRRYETAFHRSSEGPYRGCHRSLSERHARHRPRPLRAAGAVGHRRRFRPRHRTRHRQLSLGARGAAVDFARRHGTAAARHADFERAGLL